MGEGLKKEIYVARIRYFTYIPIMKQEAATNRNQDKALRRQQILQSILASFKIEGILIPPDVAQAALKKIEVSLEK